MAYKFYGDMPPHIRETFCAAPFTQLLLDPTGHVHPCCYHFGYKVGDVRHAELSAIWNGPKLQKLRTEFLTGQIKTCRGRMLHIQCHKHFERLSQQVVPTAMQAAAPRRLDIRLNGQCNLECKMCDVWQKPNGVYEDSSIWNVQGLLIFVEEIDVLGGEPFIQKDTFRLIELVSQINPKCKFGFVSNGNYRFKPRVSSYLDKIDLRFFQLSIDSLHKETYERIRRKGTFELMRRTVDELCEYHSERGMAERGFELVFSMCVLKDNWREIPAFIAFCKERGARVDLQFAFYDPSNETSLKDLPTEEKQKISAWLIEHVDQYDQPILVPILSPLGFAPPV